MKEKLGEQCQAKEVKNALHKQLKMLEIHIEEKMATLIEMEQDKNAEITSLRQQNQALDKQLKKMRRLIAVSTFSLTCILKLSWLVGWTDMNEWMDG